MKYRVIHPAYMPTYFPTKKAAVLFQEQMGGTIQRKMAEAGLNNPTNIRAAEVKL